MKSLPGVIPAYQYPQLRFQTGIGHKRILLIDASNKPFDTISIKVESHFASGNA